MASFVQALQQQQKLVLAATPFPLQIHQQGNHGEVARAAFFCSLTSFPSLPYLRRTDRAAMREIRKPRYPSTKPPRRTKFWKKLHGVASHNAASDLRVPSSSNCCAARVV